MSEQLSLRLVFLRPGQEETARVGDAIFFVEHDPRPGMSDHWAYGCVETWGGFTAWLCKTRADAVKRAKAEAKARREKPQSYDP